MSLSSSSIQGYSIPTLNKLDGTSNAMFLPDIENKVFISFLNAE